MKQLTAVGQSSRGAGANSEKVDGALSPNSGVWGSKSREAHGTRKVPLPFLTFPNRSLTSGIRAKKERGKGRREERKEPFPGPSASCIPQTLREGVEAGSVDWRKGNQSWPPLCSRSPDPTLGPPRKWKQWSNQTGEATHASQPAVLLTCGPGSTEPEEARADLLFSAAWPPVWGEVRRWLGFLEDLQRRGRNCPWKKLQKNLPCCHQMAFGA